MEYIKKNIIKGIYKSRPKDSHKYNFGNLLIIGGSQLYSGSPALTALAALRAGIDLTMIIAPERSSNIIASFSPNLISYPLKGNDIGEYHLPEIFSLTERAKKVSKEKVACVIGGGTGRDQETKEAIVEYLSNIDIPAVIDADAIWAVSEKKDILKDKKFVLTPHQYEFYNLSGADVMAMTLTERADVVKKVAEEFKTTILLKGNIDIISDGKKIFFNKTGCPEMTVGGTGDVLAGICGCFLSQGFDPIMAASASAYINGLAGEKAKEKFGPSMIATDLIEQIPNVIKQ